MTTPEIIRCEKCPYFTEDESGKLSCAECEMEIFDISNEECPLEQDW